MVPDYSPAEYIGAENLTCDLTVYRYTNIDFEVILMISEQQTVASSH